MHNSLYPVPPNTAVHQQCSSLALHSQQSRTTPSAAHSVTRDPIPMPIEPSTTLPFLLVAPSRTASRSPSALERALSVTPGDHGDQAANAFKALLLAGGIPLDKIEQALSPCRLQITSSLGLSIDLAKPSPYLATCPALPSQSQNPVTLAL